MIIKNLRVTNYKNLKDCNITPKGLSAITGCNSSGKSNLMEVFQFVSLFLAGSDEERSRLMLGGMPGGTRWTPEYANPGKLEFGIECTLKVNGTDWELEYEVEIAQASPIGENRTPYPAQVLLERVHAKEVGKPGKATEVVHRSKEGDTRVARTEEPRKKDEFKTKSDMSALQALEVREADAFAQRFPVLSEFRTSFLSSNLLLLNPRKLVKNAFQSKYHQYSKAAGTIIDDFPLYDFLEQIQKGGDSAEFDSWLRKLCSIDRIALHETPLNKESSKDSEKDKYTIVVIHQFGRVLLPHEMSTGCAMMLGMLVAAYSFLHGNGFILLEEPEVYLHPKAIMDLVQFFRNISETKSVIFTTHSPVVLNSMWPEEVTLMVPTDGWKSTTRNVATIKEALDSLDAGFLSFGDLLQNNFNISAIDSK